MGNSVATAIKRLEELRKSELLFIGDPDALIELVDILLQLLREAKSKDQKAR